MSTDEFEENRIYLVSDQSKGVDKEVFKKFSEQYGPEIAKGYKMAFADLLPKIENIWLSPGDTGKQKAAFALYKYMEGILHLDVDLNLDESNSNANISPSFPS